jgi:ATP-dependent helicase/nuclease subunit B
MAVVYLLCGPAHSGKTAWLLERYRAVSRQTVGAALWIGPTNRNLEALRARLVGDGGTVLAPNLYTFQHLADEMVRVNEPVSRPLSDLQRRLLTDDVVADLYDRAELKHFGPVVDTRGFAEGAAALLAELKHREITPAELLRVVYRRESPVRLKDFEVARIYEEYQKLLAEHRLYDRESRLSRARDQLRGELRRPFANVRAVYVDGFSDFTRTETDIVTALAEGVEELAITLPDEIDEDRAELFTVSRAMVQRLQFGASASVYRVNTDQGRRSDRPAGLLHLERQLFKPPRVVEAGADADGIRCIEAPGILGEARMVARQIKELLLDGRAASDIIVSLRDLAPYANLLVEVFDEYGIPVDLEGTEALAHSPPVATLLRCWRLAEEDFPFAGVTALLRSGYFRPNWPEASAEATLVQQAEVLLRLLAEPRGRDAYLRAIDQWADHPPHRLEDEDAEEHRYRKTHELAVKCRPFVRRLFRAWDGQPVRAALSDHVAWLWRFAELIGIEANLGPGERSAWQRFQEEIDSWLRLVGRLPTGGRLRDRAEFGRFLTAVPAQAGLSRAPRGPGRVRILSAERAAGITVDTLFVMGLGERSFPNLSANEPLFDEADRTAFRLAGLDLSCLADRMPEEMLLFYRLVTRARKRLVLSYPAVDVKGQDLLPSSFLVAVRECFQSGAIPVERRHMLIERFDQDQPLCPAEARVQLARSRSLQTSGEWLQPTTLANLQAAERMAERRFNGDEFGLYDGRLRHPAVLAEIQRRCGTAKVFSPTALENYVACPFRFLLQNLMHLAPLEEPQAEVEQAHRGTTVHRAMSRLHTELQAAGIDGPNDGVGAKVLEQVDRAVAEAIGQAPSPAAKVLWGLEAQRLKKKVGRYPAQWEKFVHPWAERNVVPRPGHFEVAFGLKTGDGASPTTPLVIAEDGEEVRLGGRIDRVDVADLEDGTGFWIIDYKTGNPANYNGAHLEAMERLQLTLYALAVEQVLLTNARPLGLTYWLVADKVGPRTALPAKHVTGWLGDAGQWQAFRQQLRAWVVTLVKGIRGGDFFLAPRSDRCTDTCDFAQVCRISQSRSAVEKKAGRLELPVVS